MAIVIASEEFQKRLVVEALRGTNVNAGVACGSGHCQASLRTFLTDGQFVVPWPWHTNNSGFFRCGSRSCCNANGNYSCDHCWRLWRTR